MIQPVKSPISLVDAIRLGGVASPQARNCYWNDQDGSTCAMAGAFLAVGQLDYFKEVAATSGAMHLDASLQKLAKVFPEFLLKPYGCSMSGWIVLGNDVQGANREEIADSIVKALKPKEQKELLECASK